MNKFILSLLLLTIIKVGAFGQIPPGYYDSAFWLHSDSLRAALHYIIKGHSVQTYASLHTHFQNTDKKPDGTVWCMYSDVPNGTPPYIYQFTVNQCGNYTNEGDCYNREHVWPVSWFNNTSSPPYSDLFHIYPTDGKVNAMRANYPFGEVSSPSWTSQNNSKLGNCSFLGFTGMAFEPIDEYKGDFARTFFYMSVRYYTEDASWTINDAVVKSELRPWYIKLLLKWHEQDPVSAKEIDRNEKVYAIQNNRNPFIDVPQYAEMIWGETANINSTQSEERNLHVWPNPYIEGNGYLYADIPTKEDVWVQIYNTKGQILYASDHANNQNLLHIDISGLPPACYVISIFDKVGGSTYYKRFTKIRQ